MKLLMGLFVMISVVTPALLFERDAPTELDKIIEDLFECGIPAELEAGWRIHDVEYRDVLPDDDTIPMILSRCQLAVPRSAVRLTVRPSASGSSVRMALDGYGVSIEEMSPSDYHRGTTFPPMLYGRMEPDVENELRRQIVSAIQDRVEDAEGIVDESFASLRDSFNEDDLLSLLTSSRERVRRGTIRQRVEAAIRWTYLIAEFNKVHAAQFPDVRVIRYSTERSTVYIIPLRYHEPALNKELHGWSYRVYRFAGRPGRAAKRGDILTRGSYGLASATIDDVRPAEVMMAMLRDSSD